MWLCAARSAPRPLAAGAEESACLTRLHPVSSSPEEDLTAVNSVTFQPKRRTWGIGPSFRLHSAATVAAFGSVGTQFVKNRSWRPADAHPTGGRSRAELLAPDREACCQSPV